MRDYLITGVLLLLISSSQAEANRLPYFHQATTQTQVECLAEALYFEAAQDGKLGMYLVANVINNRVRDTKLEFRNLKTWCDVVHQPSRNPSNTWECAFSYYCDGKADTIPNNQLEITAAKLAMSLAEDVVNNPLPMIDLTEGALYYTQSKVYRGWMKNTKVTIVYLGHVFRKAKL